MRVQRNKESRPLAGGAGKGLFDKILCMFTRRASNVKATALLSRGRLTIEKSNML